MDSCTSVFILTLSWWKWHQRAEHVLTDVCDHSTGDNGLLFCHNTAADHVDSVEPCMAWPPNFVYALLHRSGEWRNVSTTVACLDIYGMDCRKHKYPRYQPWWFTGISSSSTLTFVVLNKLSQSFKSVSAVVTKSFTFHWWYSDTQKQYWVCDHCFFPNWKM